MAKMSDSSRRERDGWVQWMIAEQPLCLSLPAEGQTFLGKVGPTGISSSTSTGSKPEYAFALVY